MICLKMLTKGLEVMNKRATFLFLAAAMLRWLALTRIG
jgi:hypothetical protein